ncbi:hypothetical protein LSH36_576g03053 [Paralvinella palmiformis]|uniref:Uncharacterized protein n=1 Tax=Paralvinella palmiformis TaxID=53620 RepID=A0AAD9J7A2_9ANNE|nr:hypothetical protein LSH36_576g03053 [Paralvinella palmiformis]
MVTLQHEHGRLFNSSPRPMIPITSHLFYSHLSPILLAENQLATLFLAKKWFRMHQILHFPPTFSGESPR